MKRFDLHAAEIPPASTFLYYEICSCWLTRFPLPQWAVDLVAGYYSRKTYRKYAAFAKSMNRIKAAP